jgi:hypothetical protein
MLTKSVTGRAPYHNQEPNIQREGDNQEPNVQREGDNEQERDQQ